MPHAERHTIRPLATLEYAQPISPSPQSLTPHNFDTGVLRGLSAKGNSTRNLEDCDFIEGGNAIGVVLLHPVRHDGDWSLNMLSHDVDGLRDASNGKNASKPTLGLRGVDPVTIL